MAAKKKSKGLLSQLSFNFEKFKLDARVPKLLGFLCLLFAFYLFVAFSSYLFTWEADQDRVLQFSWGLLLQSDVEMSNWLGRLGAIFSNIFFFWGFGLPSYILVFMMSVIGLSFIKEEPLASHRLTLWYSFLGLIFLSILFEFTFQNSSFPWGGAFGEGVSSWLISFIGMIGTITLLLFCVLIGVVWAFNPNFSELTPGGFWSDLKYFLANITNPKALKRAKARPSVAALPDPAATVGLRPKSDVSNRSFSTGATAGGPKSDGLSLEVEQDTATEADKPVEKTPQQLALELRERIKQKKANSLTPGDSELEIAEPTPNEKTDLEVEAPVAINVDTKNPFDKPDMVIQHENDHNEPYDPTLELSSYEHPVLALLYDYADQKVEIDRAELEQNKDQIIETLLNYKIEIIKIKATIGPTVTLYEIVPAPGVRISKIKNLEDDIALSLAALGIRIIAPIPGKGTIGIEVPNKAKQVVSLKETLISDKFKRAKMDLPIAFGKTISNEVFVADLAKMPHLLIAGATGQGKSVGINVILISLLYKKHPSQIKFVMIDPKKVELFPYSKIATHFLAYLPGLDEPIVTDTTKVVHTLNSLLIEMDQRYSLLKKAKSRNITEYNEKFVSRRLNPNNGHKFMPFIVLVIDEFADLIMTAGKEIEMPISRLAQLSRAVGIHLVIATQRPSVNIITGTIKANFPARIAYRVTSKVDSRTILDAGGADQLIGRGDMLLSFGSDLIRLQCAFVDTPEVEKVIDFIADQPGYPEPFFLPEFHGDDDGKGGKNSVSTDDLDAKFTDAARLVVQNQHGSTSMIQRRLKLGYNRAGRIMDQLESFGIVGPADGSKPREVLMYDEVELERFLESI